MSSDITNHMCSGFSYPKLQLKHNDRSVVELYNVEELNDVIANAFQIRQHIISDHRK